MATYLINRLHKYPDLARYRAYDIFEVTGHPERGEDGILQGLASDLRVRHGDIDLVAGGPPCQGYSGIGHRRTFTDLAKIDVPSNHLYREMATFIAAIRPKMFLFENVKGLLHARWTPTGTSGEVWADVRRAFDAIDGYEIRQELVLAKDYGTPQNRPRVLLVGIRRDLGFVPTLLHPADGLLPDPSGVPIDPEDLLGDLIDPSYRAKAVTTRYPREASEASEWFRTDPLTKQVSRQGDPVTEHEYSQHRPHIVEKFQWMIDHEGSIREEDRTRKFAQRVIPRRWGQRGPSITATSLPDDYVHFLQPRTLSVREWARFQGFPDGYQFAGNRTTGGRRRAGDPESGDWSRELPKYTQIGNAVPVWLARAIGRHFRDLVR